MTSLMKRSLAAVGMVPARQLEGVAEELRRETKRLAKAEERVGELRAEADNWKQRYEEASARIAEHQAVAERAERRAERAEGQGAEWKQRAGSLGDEVRDLKDKLRETKAAANGAREYLMATETKLDLIEAALHVLDARTRERAVSRS